MQKLLLSLVVLCFLGQSLTFAAAANYCTSSPLKGSFSMPSTGTPPTCTPCVWPQTPPNQKTYKLKLNSKGKCVLPLISRPAPYQPSVTLSEVEQDS